MNGEDVVTIIFTGDRVDTPGAEPRNQVVGFEHVIGMHEWSAERIVDYVRMKNGEYGSLKTHMLVTNPTDPTLFDESSAFGQALDYKENKKNKERGVITSLYFDSANETFQGMSRQVSKINMLQGLPEKGIRGVPIDKNTGDIMRGDRALQATRFQQFILFNYLAQNRKIDLNELSTYAEKYFGETLSQGDLYDMADLAFRGMLEYTGVTLEKMDGMESESYVHMVSDTYRRLVGRHGAYRAPRGYEYYEDMGAMKDAFSIYAMNMQPGETLAIPITIYPESFMQGMANQGVHISDIDWDARIKDPEQHRPTGFVLRIGKQVLGRRWEDPLSFLKQALDYVAPGGRVLVELDPLQTDTPMSAKVLPELINSFLEWQNQDITTPQRNAKWRELMGERDTDTVSGIQEEFFADLQEILNPANNTLQGMIRVHDNVVQIVIDKKMSPEGHQPLIVDNPQDIRTTLENFEKIRDSKTGVAKQWVEKPAQGSDKVKKPVQHKYRSPEVEKQVKDYESELSARLGRNIASQPTHSIEETEFGPRKRYDDEVENPRYSDDSDTIQVVVRGLNSGSVTVEDLEALFGKHGEATAEIGSEPGGAPGQIKDEKKTYARVYMKDLKAAQAAIQDLHMSNQKGDRISVSIDTEPKPIPGDRRPTGNPDSHLAWDWLLQNPYVPGFIKRSWMKLFEIEDSWNDETGKSTYARKHDASLKGNLEDWWASGWAYRLGRAISRPIDILKRWGDPGNKLAAYLEKVFYEGSEMAADGSELIEKMYNELYSNETLKEYFAGGDTAEIEHNRGYLPQWIKHIPGVEVRVDSANNVERLYDKKGTLLTQRIEGKWVTKVQLRHKPLIDAWVNAFFSNQTFAMSPPKHIHDLVKARVDRVRDHFDLLDGRLFKANNEILGTGLASKATLDMYDSITVGNDIDMDKLVEYADSLGVKLDRNAEVRALPDRGNMREWVVLDGVNELYRIREFDPMVEVEQKARHTDKHLPDRIAQRAAESLGLYNDFIGKTLIYEAEPREPIWSYREENPFQLFAGRPHDMPQLVNWAAMDPYSPGKEKHKPAKYEAFIEYLDRFYEANKNSHSPGWTYNGEAWSMPLARKILERNYEAFHDMRFMALEGDSELMYPASAFESQSVLDQYVMRAASRVSEVVNYGQQGDLLKHELDRLRDPERLELSAPAKAVLKLRQARGQDDFVRNAAVFTEEGNVFVPFTEDASGKKHAIGQAYSKMTPADWQALVDENIITIAGDASQGYYAWADPNAGEGSRTQAILGKQYNFTIADNAKALINMPAFDPTDEINRELELAIQRHEVAKAVVSEHHIWHPKMLELGELDQKLRMMASEEITGRTEALAKHSSAKEAFYDSVVEEQERLRNPIYRMTSMLQRIATGLFMRLSWAVQLGTIHNAAHRTGMKNMLQGVKDIIANGSDRERLRRIGAMTTEMTEVIAMQAQSVSQENIGWNQKMLGASKYWRWRGHGGGVKGWLHAFYKGGNWTPFAFMEKYAIRGTAAVAGKHMTRDMLTKLLVDKESLTDVKRAQAEFALTELSGTIEPLLKDVQALQEPPGGWTEDMISELTEIGNEKDLKAKFGNNPEWESFVQLTNRVMQVMPDHVHYQSSGLHTPSLFRKNPVLGMVILFQRVMIAQMGVMVRLFQYGGKQVMMPATMADKEMSDMEKAGLIGKEVARKLPHLTLSLAAILGSGFAATMMSNLVRFQKPDDEDMMVQAWLMNSAVFGATTGFIESAGHYRGITRQFSGPVVGFIEDLTQDFIGTTGFYLTRPMPVDFRPLLTGDAFNEGAQDIGRTHSTGGGFTPGKGTSLSGARVR